MLAFCVVIDVVTDVAMSAYFALFLIIPTSMFGVSDRRGTGRDRLTKFDHKFNR